MAGILQSAIMAGACIGLGSVVSLRAPHPWLGALFFSIGLLYVRIRKFALLTGQNQYLFRGCTLRKWFVVLAGNFVGIALVALCTAMAYRLGWGEAGSISALMEIAQGKFAAPAQSYLFPAIFCGVLMTVATHPEAPYWVSTLCVEAFILCGFRHCVADIFYLVLGMPTPQRVLGWCVIVAGNLVGGWLMGLGMRAAK